MDKVEKTKESWQERRNRIKHKWAVPFVYPEWICERASYLLERWAFLDILGHVGRLTILIAVITYFMGADERRMQAENQRKAKHYQAWQVINAAQGQRSSGGRIDALEDLNRDGVSLLGLDVSKAYLPNLNLAGARLSAGNLTGASLIHADLTGAFFLLANLTNANLTNADLTGARLRGADLTGAHLSAANLTGAGLFDADLFGADLTEANLRNIEEWQNIKSMNYANIYGVKNPPDKFIEWAKRKGAVEIESYDKWQNLIRKKIEEMKKPEAEDNRGDQQR